MGRTGAWLMLIVVALWAAMPALACLPGQSAHSCCQQMMRDCNASAMADSSCCQVHRSEPGGVPGHAAPSHRVLQDAHFESIALVTEPVSERTSALRLKTGSPPGLQPGPVILRI